MQTTLIVVAVAGVGLLLWKLKLLKLKHFIADEDRPEIVVRNRKLRIRTRKDWEQVSSARKWRPKHPNGKSVVEYKVTTENAKESHCNSPLHGDEVEIVYETGSGTHTIKVVRELNGSKYEPHVQSDNVDLEHDGNDRRALRIKIDPDAGIKSVKVSGRPICTFPENPDRDTEVKVKMRH